MTEEVRLALPFAHHSFVLICQGISAEGQDHQPRAVDEHHGATSVWIHAHFGDVDILHEAVLRKETRKQLFVGLFTSLFSLWHIDSPQLKATIEPKIPTAK